MKSEKSITTFHFQALEHRDRRIR